MHFIAKQVQNNSKKFGDEQKLLQQAPAIREVKEKAQLKAEVPKKISIS